MAGSSQDINAIFEEIINDAQNIAVAAIKNASKQVQKDVYKKAEENLQIYYSNHSPKRYKRTNKLRRAILPYYADRSNSKNIRIEIGVEYKSSALVGAYKSNSWYHQSGDAWISRDDDSFDFDSRSNGIPEPDWILNNFLEGIHPITNVVKMRDGSREYIYNPKRDPKSQAQLMEEFIDNELVPKIDGYVYDTISNVILSKFE